MGAGTDFPQSKGVDYCNTCATEKLHVLDHIHMQVAATRSKSLNMVSFPDPSAFGSLPGHRRPHEQT